MKFLSFIWGITVLCIMVLAFIPCLGWINWINIPLAAVGLIISIMAMTSDNKRFATDSTKNLWMFGITANSLAVFLGLIRLIIGGGLL